jgi:hypothetical protein
MLLEENSQDFPNRLQKQRAQILNIVFKKEMANIRDGNK